MLVALLLAPLALAQTPPPPAKRLPPTGIAIAETDRAELTAGAAALRAEIDTLRRTLRADEARSLAQLPDYAIVDLDTPPGPKWPGKIIDTGSFDEEWK